jgi:hypothetical protein
VNALANYTIVKDLPFVRAHIQVYGVSQQDALDRLKTLLTTIKQDLPADCTVWDPEYKGFSAEAGQHYWVMVITLGADKEGAEGVITQKVGSCK